MAAMMFIMHQPAPAIGVTIMYGFLWGAFVAGAINGWALISEVQNTTRRNALRAVFFGIIILLAAAG